MKGAAVVMAGCMMALAASAKPRLIIDSDIGSSTDDIFTLELAAKYHHEGLVDFAAMMIDRPGADNLAFTKAYLHYHGLDDVAIGTIDGTTEGQLIFVPYSTLVHSNAVDGANANPRMAVPATRSGRVEESVRLYRRILGESPDNSVDICAIGFLVNLMKLLDSPGDAFSPLGGMELVAKKVRTLRIMAGSFDGSLDHPEYNVLGDVKSARRIFSSWPTRIVVTPFETGYKIYCPRTEVLADYPADHPLAQVYQVWDPDGPRSKSQLMWDPMTVLGIADESRQLGYFSDSACGRVQVDDRGFTTFEETPDGKVVLQRVTVEKALEIRAYLRAMGGGGIKDSTLKGSPVRVAEVCAVPAAGGPGEFITLRNVTSKPVELAGMRVVGSQPESKVAVAFTIPAGVRLPAKGELRFCRGDYWPKSALPDKSLNLIVYAPNGDVVAEAFVDSRWSNGAANGTGGHFRAWNDFPLPVTREQWRIVGRTAKITVMDCDPGTDDSAALFMLSREGVFPDVCVATYGNMPQPIVAANLARLAVYLGESPAIYDGAASPLNGQPPSCGDFHGADGLGGAAAAIQSRIASGPEPAKTRPFGELAARLLAVEDVTYIATGPLATLATLLEREPKVKDHIGRVYIMGGGLKSFNMPHRTEYNFFGDPLAVRKVLASGLDITLFPLDLTHRDALLSGTEIEALAATGRYPEMVQMFRCNQASNVKTGQAKDAAVLHDVLPCLYAVRPELFEVREVRLTVDEWGHLEEAANGHPLKVATKLISCSFASLFRQAFAR